MKKFKVAVLVNTKELSGKYVNGVDDAKAELDPMHTAIDYAEALASYGHDVYLCEGTPNLITELASIKPDICFNTCEGYIGESREAQIPAMLELIGIPYTGPTPTSAAMSQNKPIAKKILNYHGISTPSFQVFSSSLDALSTNLKYPLFVKPSHEGSGKGVKKDSIVHTNMELVHKVKDIIEFYNQPALVEEYIEGKDLTCGLVGNADNVHIFPVSEIDLSNSTHDLAPIYGIEQKFVYVEEYKGICPANLDINKTTEVKNLTLATFNAVQGRDYARVDFRLTNTGKVYVLEINGLPGISVTSDLTLTAYAEGWTYRELVESILEAGLARYKLL